MTGKKREEPVEELTTAKVEGTPLGDPTPEPGSEAGTASDEIARLRAREDDLLRALAEQQNVLRRRRQEMDASLRYAHEDLIRELLPVLDDFERAILAMGSETAEPIRAGVALVHDRLVGLLERQGLTAIRPLGEPFDPALHDAIAERNEPGAAWNTVLEVVQPGYRLKDRVLRHAKVVVAGPPRPGGEPAAAAESDR